MDLARSLETEAEDQFLASHPHSALGAPDDPQGQSDSESRWERTCGSECESGFESIP
jgi:hypothetical protein